MNRAGITGLLEYELKRLHSKKSFYLLLIVAVSPVFATGLIRYLGYNGSVGGLFWLQLFGVQVGGSLAGLLASSAGVASLIWILGPLFGGDLVAADLRDESIYLVLSRPLKRAGYLVGKILALSLFLAAMYTSSLLASYLSASVLIGGQEKVYLMPVALFTALVSTMFMAVLSAVIGAYTRNPTAGMIGGIGLYFITGTIEGIVLMATGAVSSPGRLSYYMAVDPIRAALSLPTLTLSYIAGMHSLNAAGILLISGGTLGYVLAFAWMNVSVSSILLYLVLHRTVERMDL